MEEEEEDVKRERIGCQPKSCIAKTIISDDGKMEGNVGGWRLGNGRWG
jgi:hypothetical protein